MKDWLRHGSLCPNCGKPMRRVIKGYFGHLIWDCKCGVTVELSFPSASALKEWAQKCIDEVMGKKHG